ncbi:MAG: outer membrane beta-barrel protein [SAR324 cluster bacterium]|nr:outer membrane beta-barrel protein [SAR324 cluster bacterium]
MEKIFIPIFTIVTIISLSPKLKAQTIPYIGLGFNSFTISMEPKSTSVGVATVYRTEPTADKGTEIGLVGGVILNDNAKINFNFFSGETNSIPKILATEVLAVTYDYGFNNQGIRRGWLIGAGLASTKIDIMDNDIIKTTSVSNMGLAVKGGYEYQINDNLLFDIVINVYLIDKDVDFVYKGQYLGTTGVWTATSVVSSELALSYLF